MILSQRTVQLICEAGLPPERLAAILHAINEDLDTFRAPEPSKRQARNQRYYDSKRLKSSESVLDRLDQDAPPPLNDRAVLSSEPSVPRSKPHPPIVPPPDFEELWKAYPHVKGRSSKRKSLAEWAKIAPATRRALPAAASRYRTEGREPKEECGAPALDRWLRDERYLDWLPVVAVPIRQLTQAEKDAHDARILGAGTIPDAPIAANGHFSALGGDSGDNLGRLRG